MKNSGTICYDERSLLYGSYSEPAIRRAEMPCINGIISIFFNLCNPLQNIANGEALHVYATMVLYVGY